MKRGAGKFYAFYAGQENFTQETQILRKIYAGLRKLRFLTKILRRKTHVYAWNSGLRRGQFADEYESFWMKIQMSADCLFPLDGSNEVQYQDLTNFNF